jgi:hypothetical protein
LSTEEEWPSLWDATVRKLCSFHGLSHQELQELKLQDCFVAKLLRYKKMRIWMYIIQGLRQFIKAMIFGSHLP